VIEQVTKERKADSKKKKKPTRTKKKDLTSEDIKGFKEILLLKAKQILANVSEFEDVALGKSRLDSSGDLSSMPIHMADLGSDNFEQEFALGLVDSERKLLREIYDALDRIEQGTYGICEGTGNPIPKARLEAQPWAKYCVEYARMLETGAVPKREHDVKFPGDDYEQEDEQ
jgi:DnaK suppressor protein